MAIESRKYFKFFLWKLGNLFSRLQGHKAKTEILEVLQNQPLTKISQLTTLSFD